MNEKGLLWQGLDLAEKWWGKFHHKAKQTRVWSNIPVLAALTVGLLLFIVMVGQKEQEVVVEVTPTVTPTPHVIKLSTPVPTELDMGWVQYWSESAAARDGFESLRDTEQWERHVAAYREAFVAVNELCADSSQMLSSVVEHEARALEGGMDSSGVMVGLRLRILSVMWSQLPENAQTDCSEWLRNYLKAKMP